MLGLRYDFDEIPQMYEEFYGFSERPFQLTPDPAFYFESVTHKKALSYLGYGLNQGEGFIVITGEVGSGKSTLVAHLKQKLDDERLTVGEVVTSALDGEEMIHVAARSFGLDVDGWGQGRRSRGDRTVPARGSAAVARC